MSDIFALDPQAVDAMDAEARANGITPDEIRPGFFRGVGRAIGLGAMRGGARTGQFIGMAGGGLLKAASLATPVESDLSELAATQNERDLATEQLSDRYFGAVDQYANNAVDYWTPRANEVGVAGRILGGLSEAALPLMATAGNPALLIGSQEMGTATDLAREGVSAPAAVGIGAIQGVATGIGFKLPFLGKTLTQRVTSGVLGNLAVGGGAALSSRELLKAVDEEKAAENFNPLDPEARFVDVLMGLAFGGIAHVQLRAEVRDATLTAQNAHHFQEGTAPGVPKDISAEVAHQEALERSIEQILSGEQVAVPAKVAEAEFSPREFVEQSLREKEAAVLDFLPEEFVSRSLTPAETPAEPARYYHGGESPELALNELVQLTDGSASWGMKHPKWSIVQDQIDQALQNGRYVEHQTPSGPVRLVNVQDDVSGLVQAFNAAGDKVASLSYDKIEGENGVRFNPSVHVSEEFRRQGVASAMYAIAEQTGAKIPDLNQPGQLRSELGQRFREGLEAKRRIGKVATPPQNRLSIERGFAGERPEARSAGPANHEGDRRQPQSSSDGRVDDPLTASIRERLSGSDLQIPTGEIDADGNPITRSAREALAEADAGITEAENMGRAVMAAVTCAIQRGVG